MPREFNGELIQRARILVRVRIDPRVAWQTVAGEAIILDLRDGKALGLNASGTLVWNQLPDHNSEEIAAELSRAFSISLERARFDVQEFMTMLRSRNFLVEME